MKGRCFAELRSGSSGGRDKSADGAISCGWGTGDGSMTSATIVDQFGDDIPGFGKKIDMIWITKMWLVYETRRMGKRRWLKLVRQTVIPS